MPRPSPAIVVALVGIAIAAAAIAFYGRDDAPRDAGSSDVAGSDDRSTRSHDDGRLASPGVVDAAEPLSFESPAARPGEPVPRGLAYFTARAAASADRELLVRVWNLERQPIAGADVRVEHDGDVPVVGATKADGSFSVREASDRSRVRVEAPGRFSVVVSDVGPGVVDVWLLLSMPFSGRVVSEETGRPIAGARVRGVHPRTALGAVAPYFDIRTDAEGLFQADVPRSGQMRILIGVPDGRRIEQLVGSESGSLTFAVPWGGRIEGRVVDVAGHPVEGATVVFAYTPARNRAGAGIGIGGAVFNVSTIFDGSYLRAGIRPGVDYVVRAEGPGGARSAEVSGVRLGASGTARVDLVLSPAAFVELWLKDETGAVIRGARVTVDGSPYPSAIDPHVPDGPYLVEGLSPGPHRIHVETTLGPAQDFTLDAVSGNNPLPVKIDAGIRIDGVAVDRKGLAVGATLVSIERATAGGGAGDTRTMRTGDGGEFAFGNLTTGPWRIVASAIGAATVEPLVVDAPARGVKLTLARLGRARVQLVRDGGGPVEGDYEIRRTRADGDVLHGSGTIAAGLVTIDGFDGQPETLEISVEGYSPFVREVRVPPEGETDLGAVVMRKGRHVKGVVVGADGLPVQGAFVLVSHLGRVVSDQHGAFDFPGVPAGRLSLLVVSEFHLKRSIELDEDASDALRIELRAGAHVEGTVVGADGQGLGGLVVSFLPVEGEQVGEVAERLRTDEDGSFEVRIAPGRYRIEGKDDADAAPSLLADLTLVEGDERKPTLVHRPK